MHLVRALTVAMTVSLAACATAPGAPDVNIELRAALTGGPSPILPPSFRTAAKEGLYRGHVDKTCNAQQKEDCEPKVFVGVLRSRDFLIHLSDAAFAAHKDHCYVYIPYEELEIGNKIKKVEWEIVPATGRDAVNENDFEFCDGGPCGSGIEFIPRQARGPDCNRNNANDATYDEPMRAPGGRKFKWRKDPNKHEPGAYCHWANVRPKQPLEGVIAPGPGSRCVRFDPLISNR